MQEPGREKERAQGTTKADELRRAGEVKPGRPQGPGVPEVQQRDVVKRYRAEGK
jgi:hypothetical protein